MTLKLVKTNPREIEVTKYSKYSYRGVKSMQKTHDLELHHAETGEPVFSVNKKDYGKGYNLKWHPYQTDSHPDLANSFEHGARNANGSKHFEVDNKDSAQYHGEGIYDHAARHGFKDPIPSHIVPTPREGAPAAHEVHFSDPDTGDHILKQASGYGGQVSYSRPYLDKHGIHPDVVNTHSGKGGYGLAKALHSEKGKSYTAIGDTHHAASHFDKQTGKAIHDTNVTATTYKAAPGKSDEDLSTAHEAKVRTQHDKHPGFSLVRHTPTIFHAEVKGPAVEGEARNDYHDVHVTSVAHQGKLMHHQVQTGRFGLGRPSSDKF